MYAGQVLYMLSPNDTIFILWLFHSKRMYLMGSWASFMWTHNFNSTTMTLSFGGCLQLPCAGCVALFSNYCLLSNSFPVLPDVLSDFFRAGV